ncbi:PAS domain-containing sensor histidine kinase [Legionella jordanis]|uniref:histidine kinase n=1 Tax=Legionella jordanis TaxID=456 RepID=A0A0W0VAS6_9GAMM|nr:PAS domain-containing sensor histidine kinase [Legionella jordanis]KTD17233.1 sensory histidine-kinase / response regulator [Legionella jordanis]RMX03350.1 PAS domain-containing sensor histidine kinase [Legionella jordanis]RMX15828.1 PAS domain-containing sensor histidine kinase [Legionella jordanis]VEH12569.1 sensory histidine-kinase / response regulator [Legionella jordanis]
MPEKKLSRQKKSSVRVPLLSHTNKSVLLSIIKSLPGSVYWKDKDGKYLGCNEVMLQMAGLSSVIGKTDFDMPWADSAASLQENDRKVMELNIPLEVEETATLASGEKVVVLTRKAPLHNEVGEVIGIIGISLNITQRKEEESFLRSSQEQMQSTLENIVANMPGHVFWKDKNGVYLGCNNRQAQSLGFRFGYEIVGKTDFDLPWGNNKAELFRRHDKLIMETGTTQIIEEKAQVDGKDATVLSHKSPMRNKEGEITGVLGISIDISDRKKIETELYYAKEQAEAASRAKTEFLENMRHDIRTPLTGIVGFSEIIKSEAINPLVKEYADNLIASSHALLDLMDQILEAIRVSSGEIPKVKKKFVLKNLVQQAIDLNMAKAASKQLNLTLEYNDEIPKYLIGDNVRIHRILLELLSNALNFTDSGFVNLKVQLANRHHREIVLKLVVEDSGMGIPKDKQEEIFLHFKRLTPSYKGIYRGAGLGLSVIKQFVDDMDGEIYVDSELRKGSTFTCVIPLKVSLLEDDTGLSKTQELELISSSNLPKNSTPNPDKVDKQTHVLVVEDNAIAQKVAKVILSQLQCQVDAAVTGQEALSLCSKHEYDFIFMDIGLPDLDGYQITRHIRAQEFTKNHHTPIIALTAHVGEEDKKRCISSGMNAVLTKPLTQKSCSEIVHSFAPKQQELGKYILASDLPQSEKELFELSSFPMLDIQEGIKTTGSEAMLVEMLQFTISSLPDDLTLLKQNHQEQDWKKTQQIAHKIKGGVVYVGAIRLKMACQYLERYWKTGGRDLLEQLYEQLLQIANETIVEVEQWIERQPST